ncbi:MAG: hypothetical protein AB8F74_04105 [Saprospiraceae bacterium]
MKIFLSTLFLLMIFNLQAQDEISITNAQILDNATVIKTVKVYDCKVKILKGSTHKKVSTYKNKDVVHTVTTENKVLTAADETEIPIEKEVKIKLTNFSGKASIYSKKDKPGRLFVDYWLNPLHTITAYSNVVVTNYSLQCPKNLAAISYKDFRIKDSTSRKIATSEKYYLFEISADKFRAYNKNRSTSPDWFKFTNKIIKVYKYPKGTKKDAKTGNNDLSFDPAATELDYVLVDKYDRDATYELEIKNRQALSFTTREFEVGPLTLPFKYRFGYDDVKPQFEADVNIGAFAGFQIGTKSYRKEQGKSLALPSITYNWGVFLSLSAIPLDQFNTTAGKSPYTEDEKSSLGTLSGGLGFILDFNRLNVGIFGGIESGFGSEAKNWNYNNQLWLGLGLGYDLNNFFKKK